MDRVEFKTADAQDLPFDDGTFDAVITESVTTFPEDKQKAVNEYARVTKRGGYVGLNESIWLKVPPPPELLAWAEQDLGANLKPLTASDWADLLKNAGLRDIVEKTYNVDVKDESKGILRRYGFAGMLRVLWRTLGLYLRSPDYRKFVKDVRNNDITPKNLNDHFGDGVFVGHKEA